MTDAVQERVRTSALENVHVRSGATMIEREGLLLPGNYGDSAAEYLAVRQGRAGLIDLSSRARISVSGSEAVMFLNGLITNDIKTLGEKSWMPAAFPNVQGRMLAAVRILNRSGDFLVDTESVTHDVVLKLLERFTLAGDFRVADLTEASAMMSVQGKNSREVIGTVLNEDAAKLGRQQVALTKLSNGNEATVIRATQTAENGFDLFVNASDAEMVWDSLLAAGARPVGFEALEILRIEAGIPRYGVDMDDTNIVTETNLDDAVSFTKGCYIGQEIIARIKYRGHVAKKLTGLVFDPHTSLEIGAKILSIDGKEIGRVTSQTFSPQLDRSIALGYVKYDYLAAGTEVRIAAGDKSQSGYVAELPLVRGSWYEK
jgi:folate-binding protein YgfZ